MASNKKTYARLSGYGDLLVPMNMLEKIVQDGMIVRTSYVGGEDQITEVRKICDVKIHDEEEIENARVQMALEGDKV
tara:strand:- start:605 stop:835 length:231 start_codon:yes stop_codon:yes gene_type:complete